ncbi:MAG: ComF family protein [Ruminococcaceae bacterium]|nr:ComF family protein [Oscillospiraceae bacterium]
MIKNPEFRITTPLPARIIYTNRCRLCAKVMPLFEDICSDCDVEETRIPEDNLKSFVYTGRHFDAFTAPFYYEEPVKKCIHNLKFHNFKRASEFLAKEMIEVIARDFSDENPDYLICVPMTKQRKRKRGYNQCEILIRKIAKAFNMKATPELLTKIKNTPPQVGLNYQQRKTNLSGAFAVNKKFDVKDKTILICDDVFTTGSTLGECAKVLKKAGAKRVICVTCTLNKL